MSRFQPRGGIQSTFSCGTGPITPTTADLAFAAQQQTNFDACNALISGVFPLLAAASGSVPFVFFAAMMVVQFIVVAAFYPETKGYTLEEMEGKLA